MNIAFIGTHGTGKTKLARLLGLEIENIGYNIAYEKDITRSIHSIGIPINENGDVITQVISFSEFYKKIILPYRKCENVLICDRSLYDDLAYIEYSNIDINSKLFLSGIIKNTLVDFWDILFYVEPKYKLINDGVRSRSRKYQLEIDRLIRDEVLPIIKKSSRSTRIEKLSSYGFEDEVYEAFQLFLKLLAKNKNK